MGIRIINTTTADLETVYSLFDAAIAYQKSNGFIVWKGYDKAVLQTDVADGRQYKILEGETLLCVFTVCYEDHIIWGSREDGNALYLHRAVINPNRRGENLFQHVLDWALMDAQRRGLDFIRMDTWADNQHLVNYYTRFGFEILEYLKTPESDELPEQHKGLDIVLLQLELSKTL